LFKAQTARCGVYVSEVWYFCSKASSTHTHMWCTNKQKNVDEQVIDVLMGGATVW